MSADPASRESRERYYGLDRPVGDQYLHYLGGLFTGDLGLSIKYNRPVFDLLAARLPWTLLFGGASLLVGVAVGATAGI